MPLVCLPLCLVLGLLRKEGGKQLGPALGLFRASKELVKQRCSHCPMVAMNEPKAKLEVSAFLERF